MASKWRDRFRIPAIYDAVVASAMPDRGMIVGGFDGQTIQVHAWEVPSGRLRAVSTGPTGTFEGWIAPMGAGCTGSPTSRATS